MKLTTFLLLLSLMQVNAASFGQKVTLKAKEISINGVFREIRKQTGYGVVNVRTNLNTNKKIEANFQDAPLTLVMEQVLYGSGMTYLIEDKNILVVKKEKSLTERVGNVVAAIDVSGKVLDSDGKPLPGATVTVKGTKIFTTTRNDGFFILRGVENDAMLVITYIGYEPKEVKAERDVGLIKLIASTNPLDEVQVIAYGTTTRRLSTGNIGTIKAKDIENQPVTNPLLALQGRVPGLVITQQTGVPGGGVTVRIQGQNSLRNGNSPLFVVDGVPIESFLPALNGNLLGNSGVQYNGILNNEGSTLSYLNPSDIESIDVLKDADATSIYGSRAANGAILITTKKGKVGKMQMEANVNTGWGKAIFNGFEMLNTRQYLDMRYEAYKNDGRDWRDPLVYAPDLKLWDTTRYTDWRKELFGGTSLTQQIRAGISGGTTNTQYRLSGSYNRTGSVFPDNGNGNPIAAISTNINSISDDKRLRMSWTANYQYNHSEMPRYNFIRAAWYLPPNAPSPLNSDGSLNWAPDADGNSSYMLNPYLGMTKVYTNTTTNLISNLVLGYKFLSNFELGGSLGYNSMQTDDFSPSPTTEIQPENLPYSQNVALYGNRNIRSWIAEPQLNYKKDTYLGKFDILIGSTYRDNKNKATNLQGTNYPSDSLLDNIGSAGSVVTNSSLSSQYRYMAYFGRLNYNLDDQFILNFSTRRDGSSRFGENRRFSTFWSLGGAWIFSQQKAIIQLLPWLSFGKITGSYGITGSDQIGDYQFIRTFRNYPLQVPYQGISGLQSGGLPNPELVWERVKKFSSSIDLGFLNDRILLNVTYAQNHSDNQLLQTSLSSVTGATSQIQNLDATVRNTTWEFGINTINVKRKDFGWSTNFNLSIARNKLIDYPGLESSTYAQTFVIGKPVDISQVLRFGGVNSATGEYQFLDKLGNPTTFATYPDDYVFRSFFPTFYGGIQNTLSWKSLSLDFFVQFTKHWRPNFDYYSGNGLLMPGRFDVYEGGNQPISVLERWKKVGDVAKIAKFSTLSSTSDYNIMSSDIWYKDASFARLKSASLSWNLPSIWANKIGLNSAIVTVSGQNLYTLTSYDGPDPETDGLNALPPLRVITLGIKVVF